MRPDPAAAPDEPACRVPPPAPVPGLTPTEAERYARQLILPGFGVEGQLRLKAARVLVAGLGGLGCPASLYLACAGVGALGLVDMDVVDASNLHRQVLYAPADVGRPKAEVAAGRLRAMNPAVRVASHVVRLAAGNVLGLVRDYDLVIDATDNFPAHALLAQACRQAGKPLVSGAVYRYEGRVMVFPPEGRPCYRCLYPGAPGADAAVSCDDGGVLGVLPGLVGVLQATEALRLAAGLGVPFAGRLLVFDAWEMRARELPVPPDPACPMCGDGAAPLALGDATPDVDPEVDADDLARRLADAAPPVVVDVREPEETAQGHIRGSLLIPMNDLPMRLAQIPRGRPVVAYCRSGHRSLWAARALREGGFEAASLRGGMEAWLRCQAAAAAKAQHGLNRRGGSR